ncbi:hypothetical protein CEUSTIGMA_g2163.t1 [Chlamydomonas eustigma]|uniref:Conserved oligomeric Golgi complex subunit 6 n=1 Tax=Chlamydomonas eustigma TaxID=1157962 RepID=A0A250WV84_9CHLO|nr:hypothetical protein CEUSTIGMA_g2163.t1 [Chlamydomonas eustigma]|eukprot:GAX74715.1 hypothetical protein CEUSTIGMA_g2163.t1 [Chlamydomonas eustigma]
MAASNLAPGLTRKVKKILEIKTEGQDVISALSTLSSFYEENSQTARRSLRSTIEKRGLSIHEQFLISAEAAIQSLDTVQTHLEGLTASYQHITSVLSATKLATSPLLIEMERLERDLEGVEHKGRCIHDFLEQYQLAPEEISALQGEEVGPLFFSALARVRQIHENCRSLLRTHHQRAGLELMDMMATYQETVYERLCRWVQGECRSIGEYDAPEVGNTLQAAVCSLRERPVLFKYCAEEVATARHNALFQRFITALTRGGPGGMPRPIEIHAHDPKRYINDMLAWVHQALAGEREFIVTLFGEDKGSTTTESYNIEHLSMRSAADNSQQVHEDGIGSYVLLDRIFESICRPLKVRIEQVLMTSPPLLLCFQLAQLHSFYLGLVSRAVGPGAQLAAVLRSCRDMASRVFFEQLRSRGDKLIRSPPIPPVDLSPPPQVAETMHQLLEIISAYESAMESNPLPPGHPAQDAAAESEISPVLAAVLDPLMDACERGAEALKPDAPSRVDEVAKIDPSAHRIYLINCIVAILNGLPARKRSMISRAQLLSDMLEGHLSALVGSEVGRVLAKCGLSEILDRIRLYKPFLNSQQATPSQSSQDHSAADGLPSSDVALSIERISEAMRNFFVLVSSPDTLPEFFQIQAPRTRAEGVSRVARYLYESFEFLYSVVDDPTSGYLEHGGTTSIKNTPMQVRTILGVV